MNNQNLEQEIRQIESEIRLMEADMYDQEDEAEVFSLIFELNQWRSLMTEFEIENMF